MCVHTLAIFIQKAEGQMLLNRRRQKKARSESTYNEVAGRKLIPSQKFRPYKTKTLLTAAPRRRRRRTAAAMLSLSSLCSSLMPTTPI